MAKVQVIARAVAREGKEDELRALLQSMLAPTHREPGCELYELYESDAAGRFYFYEILESQTALAEHVATPHYRNLQQKLREMFVEHFQIHLLAKSAIQYAAR